MPAPCVDADDVENHSLEKYLTAFARNSVRREPRQFFNPTEKEKTEFEEKINKIALQIGKIERVINMVATNASIEAARGGDAGKGFTVIADIVKTLSTQVSSLSVSLRERHT